MYKMLVVDDEYLVLMGIRQTIDWEKYNIEIIGEATNGLQGFELAMKLHPDIIISDVKMPLLNGLGLVQKLKEAKYDGAIVILSGYKDFEYAKTAFENGVFSYVLKPIDNQELIDIVVQALKKLEKDREDAALYQGLKSQLPQLEAKLLENILEGNTHLDEIKQQSKLFLKNLLVKGCLLYGKVEELSTPISSLNRLAEELKNQFSLDGYTFYTHVFDTKIIVFIEIVESKQLMVSIDKVLALLDQQEDHRFTIGISNFYEGIEAIPRAYMEAKTAAENKLFLALNSYQFYDESIQPYKKNVIAVLDMIANQYQTNLTVATVAEKLYVSESYLMHLLKENIGKTFNECLTNYRMMKAKQLLLTENYRINEIAEMVGYSDVKYFGQVFRKQVGSTPSEYVKERNRT